MSITIIELVTAAVLTAQGGPATTAPAVPAVIRNPFGDPAAIVPVYTPPVMPVWVRPARVGVGGVYSPYGVNGLGETTVTYPVGVYVGGYYPVSGIGGGSGHYHHHSRR